MEEISNKSDRIFFENAPGPQDALGTFEEYKPSEDEPYMNPRQLAYFRNKLLAWREQIMNDAQRTREILREGSLKEIDVLDRSSNDWDMSMLLRNRDRSRKLIYKIEEALERIENGVYGYCEETGEEIGLKRLEARPIATLSLEAQEWHERQERRKKGWD